MDRVGFKRTRIELSSDDEEEEDLPVRKKKCTHGAVWSNTLGYILNTLWRDEDINADDWLTSKDQSTSEAHYVKETSRRYCIENICLDEDISIEKILRTHFKFLKEELDPDELTDCLLRDDVITDQVAETMRECRSRRRKVDILIKRLVHQEDNSDLMVPGELKKALFKSLTETKNTTVLNRLKDTTIVPRPRTGHTPTAYKAFVASETKVILKKVDPLEFMDDAVIEGVLTFSEHEDITKMMDRKSRIETYLCIVCDCQDESIEALVEPMLKAYTYLKTIFNEKYEGQGIPSHNVSLEEMRQTLSNRCVPGEKRKWTRQSMFKIIHSERNEDRLGFNPGSAVKLRFQIKLPTEGNDQRMIHLQQDEIKAIENKAVGLFELNESQQAFDRFLNSCILKFQKLSFSSIVIHIKTGGLDSVRRIEKACADGTVLDLLISVLPENDFQRLLQMGATTVTLDVIMDVREPDDCVIQLSDVERHRQYLLEELDGKTFVGVLHPVVGRSINQQSSRRERTRILLESITTNKAAKGFGLELRKRKAYVWEYLISERTNRPADEPLDGGRPEESLLSYTFDIAPGHELVRPENSDELEGCPASTTVQFENKSESGIFSASSVSSTKTVEDVPKKDEQTRNWVDTHFQGEKCHEERVFTPPRDPYLSVKRQRVAAKIVKSDFSSDSDPDISFRF